MRYHQMPQGRSSQKALIMLRPKEKQAESREAPASSSAVFSLGCTNSFQSVLEENEQQKPCTLTLRKKLFLCATRHWGRGGGGGCECVITSLQSLLHVWIFKLKWRLSLGWPGLRPALLGKPLSSGSVFWKLLCYFPSSWYAARALEKTRAELCAQTAALPSPSDSRSHAKPFTVEPLLAGSFFSS